MVQHSTFQRQSQRSLQLITIVAFLFTLFSGKLSAQIPTNIDFSSGNLSNWQCWVGYSIQGTAATGCAFGTGTISAPIGGTAPGSSTGPKSRHFVTSGSAVDFYGGFPIVSPTGGAYSLRLGNDEVGAVGDRVQYLVHVPASAPSFNLQVQFAVVLQDAAHVPAGQTTFQVVAYDSATGTVLPGANNLYISKYAVPGFSKYSVDSSIAYLPWTASTVNLSGMGGKTVILECTALDCAYGGHWGYGYLDVIQAADTLIPALISYNVGGDSVVMQAPPGYKYYQWYDQSFSKALTSSTNTARTITLPLQSTAQKFNLIIKPYSSIGVADTIQSRQLRKKSLAVVSLPAQIARIYPNPSGATVHMNFLQVFTGTITLVNAVGQIVYTEQLSASVSHDIQTSRFATGIYTLVFSDEQGRASVQKINISR